jgi:hypothetical protein
MTGRRFTTGDLFSLTLAVAVSLGAFVNLPRLATAVGKMFDQVGKRADQIGMPLMGRESVPPQW